MAIAVWDCKAGTGLGRSREPNSVTSQIQYVTLQPALSRTYRRVGNPSIIKPGSWQSQSLPTKSHPHRSGGGFSWAPSVPGFSVTQARTLHKANVTTSQAHSAPSSRIRISAAPQLRCPSAHFKHRSHAAQRESSSSRKRLTMDQRGALEFTLEAFADPNSVRDVVRGKLARPSEARALLPLCPSPPTSPSPRTPVRHHRTTSPMPYNTD